MAQQITVHQHTHLSPLCSAVKPNTAYLYWKRVCHSLNASSSLFKTWSILLLDKCALECCSKKKKKWRKKSSKCVFPLHKGPECEQIWVWISPFNLWGFFFRIWGWDKMRVGWELHFEASCSLQETKSKKLKQQQQKNIHFLQQRIKKPQRTLWSLSVVLKFIIIIFFFKQLSVTKGLC